MNSWGRVPESSQVLLGLRKSESHMGMSAQDDNAIDNFLYYFGITMATLGLACAGFAVVKGMLLK